MEIILVNDGSRDNSFQIIKVLEESDKRINVYNIKNSGVAHARNYGLERAQGEWVSFVDADDYLSENMINDLLTIGFEQKSDIIMCDYFAVFNLKDKRIRKKFLEKDTIYNFKGNEKIELMKSCIDLRAYGDKNSITNIGVPWGKLYKKNVIKENGILFPEQLTNMEDTVFNLYAFAVVKNITYVPKPYYCYLIRKDSAVRGYNEHFEKMAYLALNEFHKFAIEKDLTKQLNMVIEYRAFCLYYECLRTQILSVQNKDCVSKKIREMKRISNSYEFTGGYKRILHKWYSNPQKIYGVLVNLHCFVGLYILMNIAETLKNNKR